MKKFLLSLSRAALTFAAIAMVACSPDSGTENNDPTPDPDPNPDPTPELEFKLEASLVTSDATSAQIKLTTKNIAQYAYLTETKDADLSADIIFATGTVAECNDGDTYLALKSLNPNTEYTVLIAGATVEEDFYEQIAKVSIKTSGFTEELTFFNVDYMSVSAHFNYPHDKVQQGNVLKWGITEYPIYYENALSQSDAEMINRHDTAWGPHIYFTDDKTWVFNEYESYLGQDPADENSAALYSPIVPGQPMYLIIGEYTMNYNDHWGWGDGYYTPLFDITKYWRDYDSSSTKPDQKDYWSGYYRREFFESKSPSKMSAKPEVEMSLTPIGGTLTITPTEGISHFSFGILDSGTYMDLLKLLNNESKYVQWYFTSYHAFAGSGVALTGYGKTSINLMDYYNLNAGQSYTLYITSMSDDQGSKQSFMKHTFTMPVATEPAAKVEIKGVSNPDGPETHDKVWFNIKLKEGTLLDAKIVGNYERDFASLVNRYKKSGYSEQEAMDMIITTYGVDLTAEELAAVKTNEGLNIYYGTRADASSVCAVRVRNSEGVVTIASAAMRSIKEPAAPAVNSTLFEDLKGEWTASTKLRYRHYHYRQNPGPGEEHNYTVDIEQPISCKVTIGEVGYEKQLPESVYQFFFSASNLKTKEEVDAVYAQFKTSVDDFNTHVRNQNRILCQGFDLEFDLDLLPCSDPEHSDKPDGIVPTRYASPYDLFIADANTYSAYNYESPVFDFGPKWYLEVAADGSVTAPFNTSYFPPMSQWYKNAYHFMGVSEKFYVPSLNDATGHFPVTISDDKNTITINPLLLSYALTDDMGNITGEESDYFYPNIVREPTSGFSSGFTVYSRIIEPIVLTRGYTAPSAKSATASVTKVTKATDNEVKPLFKAAPKKGVFKSRNALPVGVETAIPARVDYNIISNDEFKARSKKFAEERLNRR